LMILMIISCKNTLLLVWQIQWHKKAWFKISKHFVSWQLNKKELEGFLWSPKSKPKLEWSNLVYWDICRSYNHILCKRIELHISAALNWAIEHIEHTSSTQLGAKNQCCKYWVQLIANIEQISAEISKERA
jgi:hypothetical protein